MGDLYVLDVSLDLPASVPESVVDEVRWHLGLATDVDMPEDTDAFPLWDVRGAGGRTPGVQIGELVGDSLTGWSLTVRQELHADSLPEAEEFVARLARHSITEGVIGQLRFFENHCPELLINTGGTVTKVACALG